MEIAVTAALGQPRAYPKDMYDQFGEQGYASPIRVLSTQECQRFLQAVGDVRERPPLDWDKGHAANSRAFYEISTYPPIIDVVSDLLGGEVMLWGASIQDRPPGAVHAWHSDIESSAPSGKTVSVWIGIEHTSRDSSLLIIPYSHRFGVTVQEVRHQHGTGRAETTHEDLVRWAQEWDRRSHLVQLEMTDGDALFFDGQLWHGSHNVLGKTRQALLLQYATPDTMIRLPDLNYLDWPFRQLSSPKPPCLLIRGRAEAGINRIVSPPVAAGSGPNPQLTSRVYPLRIPLVPDTEKGWKPYPIFSGSTADMRWLSCHASVLTQGQRPHPPHAHEEEEVLLVLAGEVDLILPDEQAPTVERRRRLRAGQFVYYPAHFVHTLQTVSEDPANYLMFKWYTDKTGADSPLAFGQFDILQHTQDLEDEDGFRPRLIFEGPTAYLRRLHSHASTLTPGAGYEAHIDAYDVAIIVLQGEVETLGERVGAHSVIFYAAGEPHGMRNPGDVIAKYVVFEFHGSQRAIGDALPIPAPSLLAKLQDPRRWKRRLTHLLRRLIKRRGA